MTLNAKNTSPADNPIKDNVPRNVGTLFVESQNIDVIDVTDVAKQVEKPVIP